jgi:CheY-like chemotaxis protein
VVEYWKSSSPLLLDLRVPKQDGIEVIRDLTSRSPKPRIIVITTFQSTEDIRLALKSGARGYLVKEAEPAHPSRRFVESVKFYINSLCKQLGAAIEPRLSESRFVGGWYEFPEQTGYGHRRRPRSAKAAGYH